MKHERLLVLNKMLEDMKRAFFEVNTPATASNELGSTYHFLPFENSDFMEIQSNEFIPLESRFAIMNKQREFNNLIKIGKFVFNEIGSADFNDDIDYRNSSTRSCLNYLVDCCYSSGEFYLCILFGEKLLKELESYSDSLDFAINKKNLLIALSMSYAKTQQFDKSDYYSYLVDKKDNQKNPVVKSNGPTSDNAQYDNNKQYLYRGEVNGVKLGMSINEATEILGQPEKRSDLEKIYDIPQSSYLKYYSKGIELLFNEDVLSSIWLKSGINYGSSEDETLFTKHICSAESDLSLDSTLSEIEDKYGMADNVVSFDETIPYKIHQYQGFDIIVITHSDKIATIRLKE